MSNTAKKWYVLYTKTGCEKKVANMLSRKNVENYCPLKRQYNGRKKATLEPLFSSYVFVNITDTEMEKVRGVDNVLNFIFWLGKPAVIHDEEIALMKLFMVEYVNVSLEKVPFDMNGLATLPEGGALEVNRANLVSVKNNTVKIVLPSLGYMILAAAEKSNVEVKAPAKQFFSIDGKYQYAV